MKTSQMDDRETDDSPFAKSAAAPQPPSPRVERWRLQKAGRGVSCEIWNDTAKGGGWDVRLLEKGELGVSKRCPSYEAAHYVAECWRQDYVRAGYGSTEE
jgi:hypothetical protein